MLRVISPAKINLFLKVLGRRDDGYHELASLIQTISLADYLTFELTNKDSLTSSDSKLPRDASNLVLKAASLFRQRSGFSIFIKGHIEKNIPSEAGLGGGSSNAASTLYALNKMTGQTIPEAKLQEWAAEIGADVPFFFSSGTAYCTGFGEKVQSLKPLKNEKVTLFQIDAGLSTPKVFSRLDLKSLESRDLDLALKAHQKGDYQLFNDLQVPAFECLPTLVKLREQVIAAGAQYSLMTGSGSVYYALGDGVDYRRVKARVYEEEYVNRKEGDWFVLA